MNVPFNADRTPVPGQHYRYHPVYSLAILKKPAIICLVPPAQALIAFELEAVIRALEQELFLVTALLVLGIFLWRRAWWSLEPGTAQGAAAGQAAAGQAATSRQAAASRRTAAGRRTASAGAAAGTTDGTSAGAPNGTLAGTTDGTGAGAPSGTSAGAPNGTLAGQPFLCRSSGFSFQLSRRVDASRLAGLAVRRCWYLRPIGAVRLEYTFFSGEQGHLYLTRRRAEALADLLFPLPQKTVDYAPTRRERMLLALVNCDLLATLTLTALVLHNTGSVMGRTWAGQTAQKGISAVAAFLAHWIPVGLSGIAALGLVLLCATLSISFLRTAQISAKSGGGILETQSGVFTRVQWRVRVCRITCVDLRQTPVARLLRCAPVSFCAGGKSETPVLLWRAGQDNDLQRLLPGFAAPTRQKQPLKNRSLIAFVLWPGLGLAATLALMILLNTVWERFAALSLPLLLPLIYFAGLCAVGVEGFLYDGIERPQSPAAPDSGGAPRAAADSPLAAAGQKPNVPVTAGSDPSAACSDFSAASPDAPHAAVLVHATRLFTHHLFCVFYPLPGLQTLENPFSRRVGRCNARVLVPGHTTAPLAVKSVLLAPLTKEFFFETGKPNTKFMRL